MTLKPGVHEKGVISLSEIIEEIKNSSDFNKAGAIAVFIGVVRGETLTGERVQKIEIEAYEERANEILTRICADLEKREDITRVQIHHLVGEFGVGEELVYIAVAGGHRKSVFPVLREAVEKYKKEVPIFKKEHILTRKGKKRAYWTAEERDH